MVPNLAIFSSVSQKLDGTEVRKNDNSEYILKRLIYICGKYMCSEYIHNKYISKLGQFYSNFELKTYMLCSLNPTQDPISLRFYMVMGHYK